MTLEQRISILERRADTSDRERMSMMSVLEENTRTLMEIVNDTREIRQIWAEARGTFRLFARIVYGIRWTIKYVVLPLVLLLVAIYAWTHEGQAPNWMRSLVKIME